MSGLRTTDPHAVACMWPSSGSTASRWFWSESRSVSVYQKTPAIHAGNRQSVAKSIGLWWRTLWSLCWAASPIMPFDGPSACGFGPPWVCPNSMWPTDRWRWSSISRYSGLASGSLRCWPWSSPLKCWSHSTWRRRHSSTFADRRPSRGGLRTRPPCSRRWFSCRYWPYWSPTVIYCPSRF